MKQDKTLEKIVNLFLLHSGSMVNFTEMKGYIDNLQVDLLEAYKTIVKDNTHHYFTEDGEDGGKYCGKCRFDYPNHLSTCIVNKANKYIEQLDNKTNS